MGALRVHDVLELPAGRRRAVSLRDPDLACSAISGGTPSGPLLRSAPSAPACLQAASVSSVLTIAQPLLDMPHRRRLPPLERSAGARPKYE